MSDEFIKMGYHVISGGTDNHLILLDVLSIGINGLEAEVALDKIHITVNKNTNKSKTVNGVNNDYLDSITVKVPVVLGDLNGDGTIDDTNDVIYIDQTASAGYFLVWR